MRSIVTLLALGGLVGADDPIVPGLAIHEWGTFTVLFDDQGRQLGAVNVDDEPVPNFVHTVLPGGGVQRLASTSGPVTKEAVAGPDARVTVRLETPVLYVHLPADRRDPLSMTIQATWHGGLLTQFYPRAEVDGIAGGLGAGSAGSLRWQVVASPWQAGAQVGPATDQRVWTAPRAVQAATLTVGQESERYLFYRGIGVTVSPIQVKRDSGGLRLTLHEVALSGVREGSRAVPPGWLVSVLADGRVAWRDVPTFAMATTERQWGQGHGRPVSVDPGFDEAQHHEDLTALRTAMQAALEAGGLNRDEAAGMLATWEASWFRSPGRRLFSLLPQAWTDDVLPLAVSPRPDRVRRVMVSRIELISDRQRLALDRMATATGAEADNAWNALGRFRSAWLLARASAPDAAEGLVAQARQRGLLPPR